MSSKSMLGPGFPKPRVTINKLLDITALKIKSVTPK